MKLTVKAQEKQVFCLKLPTALVVNHISAVIIPLVLKTKGVNITMQQLWGLCGALKEYKRSHPEWVLLEAATAGGEYVKIEI